MNRITGMFLSLLLLAAMAGGSDLQDRCARLTRGQLQSVIEFLSADALEGRAPGTRGGELAETYMHGLFKQLGLDSRFQPFALQGFQLGALDVAAGGRALAFPRGRRRQLCPPRKRVQPGGRRRFRRLRHPHPAVALGRLQGRRPARQGAAGAGQRPRPVRRAHLRRQRPDLLRPLDLQDRGGGQGRRRRHPADPYHAHRRLRLAGGEELLVGRGTVPAGQPGERPEIQGLDQRAEPAVAPGRKKDRPGALVPAIARAATSVPSTWASRSASRDATPSARLADPQCRRHDPRALGEEHRAQRPYRPSGPRRTADGRPDIQRRHRQRLGRGRPGAGRQGFRRIRPGSCATG